MRDIVSELTAEHRQLLGLLDSMSEKTLSHEETPALLQTLEQTLNTHLEKEKKEVYELLERVSVSSPALGHVLNLFISEIRAIESVGTAFFERWKSGQNKGDLESDFARFHEAFKARIRHEEEIIFCELALLKESGMDVPPRT